VRTQPQLCGVAPTNQQHRNHENFFQPTLEHYYSIIRHMYSFQQDTQHSTPSARSEALSVKYMTQQAVGYQPYSVDIGMSVGIGMTRLLACPKGRGCTVEGKFWEGEGCSGTGNMTSHTMQNGTFFYHPPDYGNDFLNSNMSASVHGTTRGTCISKYSPG
jgi:hypothetical protein